MSLCFFSFLHLPVVPTSYSNPRGFSNQLEGQTRRPNKHRRLQTIWTVIERMLDEYRGLFPTLTVQAI